MDNGLILFSSYKMSDIMSDKFLGQRSHRTKRIDAKCLRGRERPTDLLGGSSAKKWGRSRPIWSVLRGDFRKESSCKSLRMNSVGRAACEESGEDEGAACNSYRLHLIHLLPSPISSRIRRRTRARHRQKSLCGLERPRASLWARNRVQKWGRSSPARCFARVQIDRRAMRNLYAPNNFASPAG